LVDSNHSADSFVFKADRPWPNRRLKIAAIVGHATSVSVRLWLRTASPGEFSLILFRNNTGVDNPLENEKALRSKLRSVPLLRSELEDQLTVEQWLDFKVENYDTDTTHVLELQDLTPDTRYGYLLYHRTDHRVMLGHDRLRVFRTPPYEDEQRAFQFAMFSCNMPYAVHGLFNKRTEVSNMDMWDFLSATLDRHNNEVDLILAGGDQCYTDGVDTLDIWKHLNRSMRKEEGRLLPDESAMLTWYRDIYRGYWGFDTLQSVFSGFPTYMIWDDHEIVDGWGSHYFAPGEARDGLKRILPDLEERGLTYEDGRILVQRMFNSAQQSYMEYQHSHNPPTNESVFDYSFRRGGCAFYVLDGRGQRDLSREDFRILGREQFERFAAWLRVQNPTETPVVFVVSAVPVLHTRAALVASDELLGGLGDDLRDSWEHELHTVERKALMEALFDAANRGIKVSILSGDVHVSAVFAIKDDEGNQIHQLTSSAITYGLSLPQSWILRAGAADRGTTEEGYKFERLALFTQSSYALVSVDPKQGEVWYKLYGDQQLKSSDVDGSAVPLSHSLAKIRLF